MAQIIEKMIQADIIVMASPVYFYSIDAQLKAVIDRTVARYLEIKNKEFYYIVTAAENSDSALYCTLECMRGFAVCIAGSVEKGIIYGKGIEEKGEVVGSKAMKQAYEYGKKA